MTLINGNIQDIGLDPLSGVLIATSVQFRTTGDIVIAPEARSYHIAAGLVSADLIPGPTRLTIQVGSHARDSFDVIVPDEGPVTLAWLIDSAVEWSPAVVSEVAGHRAAAEAAAERADAAAATAQSYRWVPQGDWVAGSYEAGDVVVYDGASYYAQSGTSVEPPAAPWVPLGSGGISDASELTGALTDQVDASAAVIQYRFEGQSEAVATSLAGAVNDARDTGQAAYDFFLLHVLPGLEAALDGKAATGHTHTAAEVGSVARSGTAVTLWSGTQAQYDALPTATRNAAGFIAVIA